MRMKLLAKMHGGRKLAADTVEMVAITGGEHLLDLDYHSKSQKVGFCKNVFMILIVILTLTYIAMQYLYFN